MSIGMYAWQPGFRVKGLRGIARYFVNKLVCSLPVARVVPFIGLYRRALSTFWRHVCSYTLSALMLCFFALRRGLC